MKRIDPNFQGIFVLFDDSKEIPELVYRFHSEIYALEVWPYLGFYYLEEDGSRTQRLSSPDVNIKNSTLDEILERDKMYKKVLCKNKFVRGWGRKRHKFQIAIQKWLSFIPKDVKKTFLDWPFKSIYTWKAIQLSAQSVYYYQLCQTNPVFAYLLIQRDQWDTTNTLSKNTLETVLRSKQDRIAELLGFEKKVRKSLRKLNTLPFDYGSTLQEFARLKKFLNDPIIIKLLNALPRITKGLYEFLSSAHSYGWAHTIQISFLLDILHLETRNTIDIKQNKKVNDRFYKEETRSYYCFSMILLWWECMNHNKNWSIKTVNSLLSHEELMIKDVTRLEEETIKNDPKFFNPAPIPYQEWNQAELFDSSRECTITPITNSYDLFLWGKEFNNCIYSYLEDILEGEYYPYLLNHNNHKYMLAVSRHSEELEEAGYYEVTMERCYKSPASNETQIIIWHVQEVKGIRNTEPPDSVWKCIDEWFKFVR